MAYRVVFDVIETGYRHWWFPASGAAVGTAAAAWLVFELTGGRQDVARRLLAASIVAFAALWSAATLGFTYSDYHNLRTALDRGAFVTVEGRVTHFKPMRYEGHGVETFTVAGHTYEYSDYELSAAFNNTSSHGGPIRDGVQVRIADVDGKIARLEVAQ